MEKYFVGIRLPAELEEQCEFWRRRFKAPGTVSHITLAAPFLWQSAQEDLLELIKQSLAPVPAFRVEGRGLGSFGKRVIFVKVKLSPLLKAMQNSLTTSLAAAGVPAETRPYCPHITLATRLKPWQFSRFQEELADFEPSYSFCCERISLFWFNPEGKWQQAAVIPCGS